MADSWPWFNNSFDFFPFFFFLPRCGTVFRFSDFIRNFISSYSGFFKLQSGTVNLLIIGNRFFGTISFNSIEIFLAKWSWFCVQLYLGKSSLLGVFKTCRWMKFWRFGWMEQSFFLKLFRLVKWNTYDYITEKLLGSLNSSLHMMNNIKLKKFLETWNSKKDI